METENLILIPTVYNAHFLKKKWRYIIAFGRRIEQGHRGAAPKKTKIGKFEKLIATSSVTEEIESR